MRTRPITFALALITLAVTGCEKRRYTLRVAEVLGYDGKPTGYMAESCTSDNDCASGNGCYSGYCNRYPPGHPKYRKPAAKELNELKKPTLGKLKETME